MSVCLPVEVTGALGHFYALVPIKDLVGRTTATLTTLGHLTFHVLIVACQLAFRAVHPYFVLYFNLLSKKILTEFFFLPKISKIVTKKIRLV